MSELASQFDAPRPDASSKPPVKVSKKSATKFRVGVQTDNNVVFVKANMTTNFAVEFLMWLLIAASLIAVLAARLRIPYTVALVLGGLALGSVHLPIVEVLISHKPDWLMPECHARRLSSTAAVRRQSEAAVSGSCVKMPGQSCCWRLLAFWQRP